MSLALYAHPFSSYCQKALIALYEKGLAFDYRIVSPDHPENAAKFGDLWPIGRFPILLDDEKLIVEATIIIEHLDLARPKPRLIPSDPRAALDVRMFDRIFDNYVMTPMQRIVADALRQGDERDPRGVADAHALLEKSYAWLETRLTDDRWICSGDFSLADCAAGPSLFYADWVHPIPSDCPKLIAYRKRLNERPSFARAIDEARPFRPFFPLGAPDRD